MCPCVFVMVDASRLSNKAGPIGGPIGGENLGDFLFSYFLICLFNVLMLFWGLFFKMANYRFLIGSNTFWMDFGTSKILTFFGPVVDP